MKFPSLLLNVVALFALHAGTVLAAPQDGFSLNAGLTRHNTDNQCASCGLYSSSGLSLGLDYQVAISETLSISPFFMTSAESTNVPRVVSGHGILGAQLRYWSGDMFFGGHLGSYSEVLTTGGVSISGSGGGAGLVAGWEKPKDGLYLMGQLDSAKVQGSGVDTKLTAFRFSVGYRWK